MADNILVTEGADATVRTKDRAGVETQVVIIDKNGGATENLGLTGSKTQTAAAPTDASATEVLAANAGRKSALIVNYSTGTVFVGPSGITTATGTPLAAGASLADDASTDAWYAICDTGVTGDLRITEVA